MRTSTTRMRASSLLVAMMAMGAMIFGFAGVASANGANGNCGAYCPTPSQPGDHGNQPADGTKGNADSKNPPGQAPNGSDHNNGYECDGNKGIGQGNPAHTGCSPTTTSKPTTTSTPPTTRPDTDKTPPTTTKVETPPVVVGNPVVGPTGSPTEVEALNGARPPVVEAQVATATTPNQLAFTGSNTATIAEIGLMLFVLGCVCLLLQGKPRFD